jgi:uncharacterized protein
MVLLDANILIGAFRQDDADHARLKAWLEATIRDGVAVTFPALVEVAFLRIVTHPRIYRSPSPLVEAIGFQAAQKRVVVLHRPRGRPARNQRRLPGERLVPASNSSVGTIGSSKWSSRERLWR